MSVTGVVNTHGVGWLTNVHKDTVGTPRWKLKESENKHVDASKSSKSGKRFKQRTSGTSHFCLSSSHLIETLVVGEYE